MSDTHLTELKIRATDENVTPVMAGIVDQMNKSADALTRSMRGVTGEFDKLKTGMEGVNRQSETHIGKGVTESFGKANTAIMAFAGGLSGGVIGMGLSEVARRAGELAKESVNLYAALEDAQTRARLALGQSKKDTEEMTAVMAQLKKETGIASPENIERYVKFSAVTARTKDENLALFKMLSEYSRTSGTDIDKAMTIGTIAINGMKEPLKELPHLLNGLAQALPELGNDFERYIQRVNPQLQQFGLANSRMTEAQIANFAALEKLYGPDRLGLMRAATGQVEIMAQAMDPSSRLGMRARPQIVELMRQGRERDIQPFITQLLAGEGAFEKEAGTDAYTYRAIMVQRLYNIQAQAKDLEQQLKTQQDYTKKLQEIDDAQKDSGKVARDAAELDKTLLAKKRVGTANIDELMEKAGQAAADVLGAPPAPLGDQPLGARPWWEQTRRLGAPFPGTAAPPTAAPPTAAPPTAAPRHWWQRFQEGGVVPGAPGDPVPIIAHGGETVIPQAQRKTEEENTEAVKENTEAVKDLLQALYRGGPGGGGKRLAYTPGAGEAGVPAEAGAIGGPYAAAGGGFGGNAVGSGGQFGGRTGGGPVFRGGVGPGSAAPAGGTPGGPPSGAPEGTPSTEGGLGASGLPEAYLAELRRQENAPLAAGTQQTSKAAWDYKQWSIGYGTKSHSGEVIDRAEAERRLNAEVGASAKAVDAMNPNLDPGTRAALVDLHYNGGQGALNGIADLIKSGNVEGIKQKLLGGYYARAGGRPNAVLARRRAIMAGFVGKQFPATGTTTPSDAQGTSPTGPAVGSTHGGQTGFDESGRRYSHLAGAVTMDGQSFGWGSGGAHGGSLPLGDYFVNVGNLGTPGGGVGPLGAGGWGGRLPPAVAGIGLGQSGNLSGFEIHMGSSNDLDRLYSAGCFAIAPNDWPRFRQSLLAKAQREGKLMLHVHAGAGGRPVASITSGKDGAVVAGGRPTRDLVAHEEQQQQQRQLGGQGGPGPAAAAAAAAATGRHPGSMQRAAPPGGYGPGWRYDDHQGWTYSTGHDTGIQSGALADISPGSPTDPTTLAGRNLSADQRAGRNLARPVGSQPIGPRSTDPAAAAGRNQALDPTALAGANHALERLHGTHRRLRAEMERPIKMHIESPKMRPSDSVRRQTARHLRERDKDYHDRKDDNQKLSDIAI